jgi:hypothetical protein
LYASQVVESLDSPLAQDVIRADLGWGPRFPVCAVGFAHQLGRGQPADPIKGWCDIQLPP